MTGFDAILALDWSGQNSGYRGIAVAEAWPDRTEVVLHAPPAGKHWRRTQVADWLEGRIGRGERLLITIDCAFSMPYRPGEGYLGGRVPHIADAPALWAMLDAASGGALDFGVGAILADTRIAPSYWTSGRMPDGWTGEKRLTETSCAEATGTRPETVFKLIGAKQVGKAALTGMRLLHHLRRAVPDRLSVWPFEDGDRPVVLAENYPTLFRRRALGGLAKITDRVTLDRALAAYGCGPVRGLGDAVTDHAGDALVTAAGLRRFLSETPDPFALPPGDIVRIRREGWILGIPVAGSG